MIKTKKIIPARLINYLVNILFNIGLFFLVFTLGDFEIKIFFNKLDLMIAIIPIFLTLGIEKVFPFEQYKFNPREIFSNSFFLISIMALIMAFITLIIDIDYISAIFLSFIYSYSNLSMNLMIISDEFNKKFVLENTIKLVFLSFFAGYMYSTGTRLSINSLITISGLIITYLMVSNYKFIFLSHDQKSFVKKYIPKSKYLLFLILLGTFYGNIPRIFEIFFGGADLSVKFFFWIKLIAYLSALGTLYNYLILKYLIKDEGFSKVMKSALYSLIIYGSVITFLNFLNARVCFGLFLEHKIPPIYLVVFSLSTFLAHIRDLFVENMMSIKLEFRKKFIMFSKVVCFNLGLSLVLDYLDFLNTLSVVITMFLSTIYWFALGIFTVEHSSINGKFLKLAVLIFFITGIINSLFIFYKI